MTYHHGGLPEAILDAAERAVRRGGPEAVSLRALAREVGVTHTAPRHHFGDKRGVLTALAVQGYAELASRLASAAAAGFLEVGVAYVAFALDRPAHFQLLFRSDLVDPDNPDLQLARSTLSRHLIEASQRFAPSSPPHQRLLTDADVSAVGLAAWSMAHGFSTLALAGNLTPAEGEDMLDLARSTLRHLRSD
ncbi:MAG: TetR/AcrR family transcriptional regulator [Ornithinimicrobium sp.]